MLETYKAVPWMTELRLDNLSICLDAGFKPASSLPTEIAGELRPAIEIAKRLNAIKALILWLLVSPDELESETILNFVNTNDLKIFMNAEEKDIIAGSRDDEEARNLIGWKFENAWSLAWYFGYKKPDMNGEMMSGEQMQEILDDFSCPLDGDVKEWVQKQTYISQESLIKTEDLFYCLHNAVRSAQLGESTVPKDFHPIGNGGVIHERRQSLTWMLSKGVDWDDTDVST